MSLEKFLLFLVIILAFLLLVMAWRALRQKQKSREAQNENQNVSSQITEELMLKEAQLKALQNQINPHFLYNTLDTIRGQAYEEGALKTAEMTEALSMMFRYTIGQIDNLVSIDEEIQNVMNFVKIQQYRFQKAYTVRTDIQIDLEKQYFYKIPKLTLQPIVENAMHYGRGREKELEIDIRVYCTQYRLIISVVDNGKGMSEQALKTLNEKLNQDQTAAVEGSKGTGIGLMNINERIKYLFGKEYGITVYSMENIGTKVEVSLPLNFDETKVPA